MKNNSISLETISSGFNGPELIIIVSKPRLGKTFLALKLAVDMAVNKNKLIAFFSLETSKDALAKRIPKISDSVIADMQDLSFFFLDTTPQMTFSELEQHIRNLYNEKKIEAVFIDYLGLLTLGDNVSEQQKDKQAILLTKLKNLATQLNIPFVVVLQRRRDYNEPTPQTVQSQISSEEAFQCIDKLFSIHKTDISEFLLTFFKRSQHNEWSKEEIEWTIPQA
jgi:replicative DNA helicase